MSILVFFQMSYSMNLHVLLKEKKFDTKEFKELHGAWTLARDNAKKAKNKQLASTFNSHKIVRDAMVGFNDEETINILQTLRHRVSYNPRLDKEYFLLSYFINEGFLRSVLYMLALHLRTDPLDFVEANLKLLQDKAEKEALSFQEDPDVPSVPYSAFEWLLVEYGIDPTHNYLVSMHLSRATGYCEILATECTAKRGRGVLFDAVALYHQRKCRGECDD